MSLGRQVGATSAVAALNKNLPSNEQLTAATIDTWLFRFRKEENFWEKTAKRGRPAVMDSVPGARDEFKRQVSSFRSQGESVTARVSSTIMKAVLEEKAGTQRWCCEAFYANWAESVNTRGNDISQKK